MEIGTIIALVIALAAVVVGPVIQLQIAKRQIRAQLVSANRQKWIEDLRTRIADFLSASSRSARAMADVDVPNVADEVLSMERIIQTVTLSMNPEEPAHRSLLAALGDLFVNITEDLQSSLGQTDISDHLKTRGPIVGDKVAAIQQATRDVIKSEWERVKRGE